MLLSLCLVGAKPAPGCRHNSHFSPLQWNSQHLEVGWAWGSGGRSPSAGSGDTAPVGSLGTKAIGLYEYEGS